MKKRLHILAVAMLAAGMVTAFWIFSNRIRVRQVTVASDAFARIFGSATLVHLSDLHFRTGDEAKLEWLLARLQEIDPDYIFLTGDFVRWHGRRDDYALVFQFFRRLRARRQIFAVLGDADYSFSRLTCGFCHQDGRRELRWPGRVRVLRDEAGEVRLGDHPLRIAGVDCGRGMVPPLHLVDPLVTGPPAILLSHSSLVFRAIDPVRDVLVLSGDTHGGQIWLPDFIWRLWQRKPDWAHMYGLFAEGNKRLYVTSGVGFTDALFRIGMPPEIAVIRFVPVTHTQDGDE